MSREKRLMLVMGAMFLFVFFLAPRNVSAETCLSSGGVSGTCTTIVAGCPSGYVTTNAMQACSNNGICCVLNNAPSNSNTITTTNATASNSSSGTIFPNPLKFTTVSELLTSVITNLMGVMAMIALVFMIIGGIMYMTSGGNDKMITRAKNTWTAAIIGLAIAMAAPTFLKTIQTILGGSNTGPNWFDPNKAPSLNDIAVNVLNLLLSILGVIAMISMVIGGIMYLTAAGDDRKIEKGKNIFKYSLLGVVAALSSVVVINEVSRLLGAQ